jgi:tRNA (Thr-GGU) A37 N-methylase
MPDLHVSQNQPQHSADDWHSRILKDKIKIEECLDEISKTGQLVILNYVTESRHHAPRSRTFLHTTAAASGVFTAHFLKNTF